MEAKNFVEKRRSTRVLCKDNVKAFAKSLKKPMVVRDISYHGALLKTRTSLYPGDILDLSMDVPMEPIPIDVNAKVVRTVTVCTAWGFCNFDIGIEFIDLIEAQKKTLTKTVDRLLALMKQGIRV